jgi:4-diphosphocytidyl-2-C-methyl-D-erythritol kinase
MVEFPCSKINLGLYVTGRRPDGYHNIETIFYPLDFSDILEVVVDPEGGPGEISLTLSGLPVPGDAGTNLVVMAYRLLQRKYRLPAVRAFLHKCIPTGAGLGGGSSDAVSMLRIMDRLAGLGLTFGELSGLALELGSDCPFFLDPRPVNAMERGELIEPLTLALEGWLLRLYHPGTGISTAAAYRNVPVGPVEHPLRESVRHPVKEWRQIIRNDFEGYAIKQEPLIGRIRDELYASGADYASMTGSGSAVYGLFGSDREAPSTIARYLIWEGRL